MASAVSPGFPLCPLKLSSSIHIYAYTRLSYFIHFYHHVWSQPSDSAPVQLRLLYDIWAGYFNDKRWVLRFKRVQLNWWNCSPEFWLENWAKHYLKTCCYETGHFLHEESITPSRIPFDDPFGFIYYVSYVQNKPLFGIWRKTTDKQNSVQWLQYTIL